MDRPSSFTYPRRSKPQRNYADYYADNPVIPSDDDNNTSDEDYRGHRFRHGIPSRNPRKQRKLSTITAAATPPSTSNYHFTTPALAPTWSEQATFVLLEVWGDRFLQLGRTSLRSEDWKEVTERVSQATRSKRNVSECRNRLNILKEKYKREKAKWGVLGSSNSKWVFYKKMDGLMTMSPRQLQQQELCGLACGVDSGEFVFMNPRVYLEHSNALDEMRDSPGNSESEDKEEEENEEEDEESEEDDDEVEESYRMLSQSIKRVGEIYEKIEDSKRCHMMELERMRVEFHRDLEVQKKEMVDQTSAEIARFSQRGGDQGSDCDAENVVSE